MVKEYVDRKHEGPAEDHQNPPVQEVFHTTHAISTSLLATQLSNLDIAPPG